MNNIYENTTRVDIEHVLDVGILYLTKINYTIDGQNKIIYINDIKDIEDFKKLCNIIKNLSIYNNKVVRLDIKNYLKKTDKCKFEDFNSFWLISDVKSLDILYAINGHICYSYDNLTIKIELNEGMKKENKEIVKYFLDKNNYSSFFEKEIII